MERPPGADGLDRSPQPHGIEGLYDPSLRSTAPSEKDVSATIEEKQDGHMWHAAPALFQPQIEADRDAAHRADLKVDDGDVGRVRRGNLSHGPSRGKLRHGLARRQYRQDLLTYGRGVRHHQDAGHAPRL